MSTWTHHRARVGALSRDRSPDDPELIAAREALSKAKLEDSITRAVDDPAQLTKAARIVRTALARQRITLADLTPLPDLPEAS